MNRCTCVCICKCSLTFDSCLPLSFRYEMILCLQESHQKSSKPAIWLILAKIEKSISVFVGYLKFCYTSDVSRCGTAIWLICIQLYKSTNFIDFFLIFPGFVSAAIMKLVAILKFRKLPADFSTMFDFFSPGNLYM